METGFLKFIEKYKLQIKADGNTREIYKWECIQHFQQTFDIDAPDFERMLRDSMKKVVNLIYVNSLGFIIRAAKHFPEEIREMFRKLYDVDIELQLRITNFQEEAKEILPAVIAKHGKPLNHQQDERTISFYLAMKYPERYPLFKDDIYKLLLECFPDENSQKAGKKYVHYIELSKRVLPLIAADEDLKSLSKATLTPESFSGDQTLLIFQDILWRNRDEGEAEEITQQVIIQNTKEMQAKNIILYGPPGTGKTYNSIDKAVQIISGKSMGNHESNKSLFDKLRKEGRIEFITFHQNYSYEDFMVGLKPDAEFEQLRFKPFKGVFYEIAERAKENYFASKEKRGIAKDFDLAYSEIVQPLSEGSEVEVKMRSGISYYIYDQTPNSILFRKNNGSTIHTLSIDTLRELAGGNRKMPAGLSPYYSPLINMIKEKQIQTPDKSIETLKNFVLIIDEINRANISRVFGELISLLEEDKRLGEANELKVKLPNGEENFGIPPNLYVVGTMNTADKSIALVDIAIRRRFEFIGYYPEYNLPELNTTAVSLLKHINKVIYSKKKSADYLIGHAYFLNNNPIKNILKRKIIPLLMEYFSGKTEIVTEIFSGSGWQVTYSEETYSWEIKDHTGI